MEGSRNYNYSIIVWLVWDTRETEKIGGTGGIMENEKKKN